MNTIRNRLDALELVIDRYSDSCPACGADWPGSVVLDDGEPKCIRCHGGQSMPTGKVKAYADVDDGEVGHG